MVSYDAVMCTLARSASKPVGLVEAQKEHWHAVLVMLVIGATRVGAYQGHDWGKAR